uniref:IlGF domain-containing protein n=1 Tax=Angiostrongylus cantonensis TaxID=6313 RepID=A0A0K0CWY0_ANGCA
LSIGIFARLPSVVGDVVRQSKPKRGSLKLCPPGGPSFLDAFNLICPMRRRRRSISDFSGITSLERTMQKCCEEGCHFGDIFAICNPFG